MAVASLIVEGRKRCGRCEAWKPVDEFYLNKRAATGLTSWCKECLLEIKRQERTRDQGKNPERWREYKARYHAKHPDRVKAGYRKQKLRQYGVTVEWYEERFAEQEGLCKICRQPETAIEKKTGQVKELAVDHCHVSSKARGLLCTRCNTALGLLQDNPELLRAAATYLEEQS